ncbi:MAG: YfhO family protein [Myxococcales bacterium]|nr:YfhO family protein [Myxococcales bacterium]
MSGRGQRVPAAWYALGGLLLANLALWKFRIIGPASDSRLTGSVSDLYNEHYPMMKFGFESLASGTLPLWNPYQLMGAPFLAVPNVGLFYPPNWIYAILDTGVATEVSLIAHLSWAGLGMFLLAKRFELSSLAATAAAVTFMWSGYMGHQVHTPSLITGMSWLPLTVLAVEGSLKGSRAAALGLIAAVAFQLLNGAPDYFVQNMYVAGGYSLLRLISMALNGARGLAIRRGSLLLACVVCGALLAAPQLLPTLELASMSVRTFPLTLREATWMGVLGSNAFLANALRGAAIVSVGLLPLAGMALGFSTRLRLLWAYLLVLAVVSFTFVLGGELYRLYFETPAGSFSRRPIKFLHIYDFAQALMAGLAVLFLEGSLNRDRRELLRMPAFVLCLGVLAASLTWLMRVDGFSVFLAGLIVGLVAFVALRSPRLRMLVVVALVGMQAANLFWGTEATFIRPVTSPERFQAHREFLTELRQMAGHQRVHLSAPGLQEPDLVQKTGLLSELRVLGDYSPLASIRSQGFFRRATRRPAKPRFFGYLALGGGQVDWPLFDLTSTRYYVARTTSPEGGLLYSLSRDPEATGLRLVRLDDSGLAVFERKTALPRAYLVPMGNFLGSAGEVLRKLSRPSFDPRAEVLLEDERFRGPAGPPAKAGTSSVKFLEDGREKVVLEVESTEPGLVVLNDAYYPGWEARIGSKPTDIYRANYLFRAVQVPAGRSVITMEYRPASLRVGLMIAGGTAILLTLAILFSSRFGPISRSEDGRV